MLGKHTTSSTSFDGDDDDDDIHEAHTPLLLKRALLEEQATTPMAAAHTPKKAKMVGVSYLAAGASFNAVPSGAATHEDAIQRLYGVVNSLRDKPEHREDGYDEIAKAYYTKSWVSVEHGRFEALRAHPDYTFIEKVAGISGRKPETLFNTEAFDQTAKRMLQRAATIDEVRREALKDIGSAQTIVQGMQKKEKQSVADIGRGRAVLSNLRSIQSAYADNVEAAATRLQAEDRVQDIFKEDGTIRGTPLRHWFSATARCRYPGEGADSVLWADQLLQWFEERAVDATVYTAWFANDSTADVGALQLDENATTQQAQANNPRAIRVAAVTSLVSQLARVPANLDYVVRRVAGEKLLPASGHYATNAQDFAADIRALFALLAEGDDGTDGENSKTHVSWRRTTYRVYLHLRCMHERWYGPELGPDAVGTPSECQRRPVLEQPVPVEVAAPPRRAFSTRNERVNRANLYDASGVSERRALKIENPRDYQLFVLDMFTPLYRHGLIGVLYDTAKLQRYLCDSDVYMRDSLVCVQQKKAVEAFDKMLLVQASSSVDQTLLRTDFFFGAVPLQVDVYPSSNEKSVESYIGNVLLLYLSALDNLLDDKEAKTPEDATAERTVDNDAALDIYMSLERRLGCSGVEMRQHREMRARALVQLAGGVELYRGFVRAVLETRTLLDELVALAEATALAVSLRTDKLLDTLLLQDEERALLDESRTEKPATDAYRRAVRRALHLVLREQDDFRFEDRLGTLIDALEKIMDVAYTEQVERSRKLAAAADELVKEIKARTGNIAGGEREPEDERERDIVAKIERLKRILSHTYVPSAQWAIDPQNTGVIMLSAKYTAAVDMAYEMVQANTANLASATLEDLKLSPITRTIFAELVAHVMARTEARNPSVLTLNRFMDDTMKAGRSLMIRMRKLPRIPNIGIGAPRRIGYGRTSQAVSTTSSVGDFLYGERSHAPRNQWVMIEARDMRRNYERERAKEEAEHKLAEAAAQVRRAQIANGGTASVPVPPAPVVFSGARRLF